MPTDRSREPQPGRGFTRLRTPLMIASVAAIALGIGLGLLVRPNLGAARDTEAAERSATPMQVEIDHTAPPPPPVESAGKLEVLPPDVAAGRKAADPSFSALTSQALAEALAPDAAPRPGPSPDQADPWRQARAGVDCASSLAQQMVCSDPDLAAADRAMSRAYGRALRAGISPDALRADQRDWLAVREEAARHSRRALAQVYQQRIDELNSAVDDDAANESY